MTSRTTPFGYRTGSTGRHRQREVAWASFRTKLQGRLAVMGHHDAAAALANPDASAFGMLAVALFDEAFAMQLRATKAEDRARRLEARIEALESKARGLG